jgi:hypothetical protein
LIIDHFLFAYYPLLIARSLPPRWHTFIVPTGMRFFTRVALRRFIVYLLGFLLFVFIFLIIVAERFVEPVIKDRLHTLIVQGSDGLYTYKLGNLDASFLGGSVEIEDLQIDVDSARYAQLVAAKDIPSLTMQLDLKKGHIKGIAVFSLLFSKKVMVHEILSEDANVQLTRHKRERRERQGPRQKLWKAIQPAIKLIDIDHIELDGIKLLYKHADTSESMQLQFDTCYARFDDIRIDSLAAADVSRIGFTKEVSMRFRDLNFRTPDSIYKMRADEISFSSKDKSLEMTEFKLQPTLAKKEDFYRVVGERRSMNTISFQKARLTNFQLDRFIHSDIVSADSLLVESPDLSMYTDKTQPMLLESKMGKYPHQNLLRVNSIVQIKGMAIRNGNLSYTEKGEKTQKEGTLTLNDFDVSVSNITNDSMMIVGSPRMTANMKGRILGQSPMNVDFVFYLDSTNGRFDANGNIGSASAGQLNQLAEPLANIRFQSFNLQSLAFRLAGDDYGARGSVFMRYSNLFLVVQKKADETGAVSTNKFLTKIVNKYTLRDSNPGPDGIERKADPVIRARLTTQSFFGLIWQTIFTGMQNVMMNTGRIET